MEYGTIFAVLDYRSRLVGKPLCQHRNKKGLPITFVKPLPRTQHNSYPARWVPQPLEFNPAVPPPVNLTLFGQVQPILPVELQPQNLTGPQYGTLFTPADWDQIQGDLTMAVADYMPHTNDGPLKWQDQLERKDCPVFSGKSQEDVVDRMHRLRSYMSFAQCNPNKGEATDQKIQAAKFLIRQCLREEPLKWWVDKENQLTNLNEWNQALQGLKKHFAPGGKVDIQWRREWDEITLTKYSGNLILLNDTILQVGEYCDMSEQQKINKIMNYLPMEIYVHVKNMTQLTQIVDAICECAA